MWESSILKHLFTRRFRMGLLFIVTFTGLNLVNEGGRVAGDADLGISRRAYLNRWLVGDEERNIEQFAVNQVQPAYPLLAEKYKIQGVVTIQVLVSRDGRVEKAEFVRGHTIFRSVSLDAAKHWEFKPPDGNGLEGFIRFTFKLKG